MLGSGTAEDSKNDEDVGQQRANKREDHPSLAETIKRNRCFKTYTSEYCVRPYLPSTHNLRLRPRLHRRLERLPVTVQQHLPEQPQPLIDEGHQRRVRGRRSSLDVRGEAAERPEAVQNGRGGGPRKAGAGAKTARSEHSSLSTVQQVLHECGCNRYLK